ncbi:hypothetical protein E2C01_008606 [Portunus trituberculatus]|uniref:Uncharacterized protein n=1 Tax=Portunus trituberculatus TaxID=210409 RepID=A0A5B7D5J6_PORTR|nr:hypothetical protein [Portunus trituberculatus]
MKVLRRSPNTRGGAGRCLHAVLVEDVEVREYHYQLVINKYSRIKRSHSPPSPPTFTPLHPAACLHTDEHVTERDESGRAE